MKPKIVLVSGASGSGKTTLIKQLREDTLTPEIRGLLPELCGSWPALELNDLLKGNDRSGLLAGHLAAGHDLLLHYDIVMPFRYRMAGYEGDPAWAHIGSDYGLTILFIRPEKTALLKQHALRSAQQKAAKSALSKLNRAVFRQPLRALTTWRQSAPQSSTVELYASHDFIETCHRLWMEFATTLLSNRDDRRLIVLRPGRKGHDPSFDVVATLNQP